jgi:transposase InsO family protein
MAAQTPSRQCVPVMVWRDHVGCGEGLTSSGVIGGYLRHTTAELGEMFGLDERDVDFTVGVGTDLVDCPLEHGLVRLPVGVVTPVVLVCVGPPRPEEKAVVASTSRSCASLSFMVTAASAPSVVKKIHPDYERQGHVDVWRYLKNRKTPKRYDGTMQQGARKAFKQNARRRFRYPTPALPSTLTVLYVSPKHPAWVRLCCRLDHTGLWYKAGAGGTKSFLKSLRHKRTPWRRVLGRSESLEVIRVLHATNHDSHNRMETSLGEKYMICDVRAKIAQVRALCDVCDQWKALPKRIVAAILTSRPMQLVMFDLSFMPMKDSNGFMGFLLVADHFSKMKWGMAVKGKTKGPVADYLYQLFSLLGSPERWHCDNGKEFVNNLMDEVAARLGIPEVSHGRPRNPQCQGLIERANRTVKSKLIKRCQEQGYVVPGMVFDWVPLFEEVIQGEITAPIKMYGGFEPFFVLHGRRFHQGDRSEGLSPADKQAMHDTLAEKQEEAARKMMRYTNGDENDIPMYEVGDHVYVHADYRSRKEKWCISNWSANGTIHSVHATDDSFYKIMWVSVGLSREKPGVVSKSYFPALSLKAFTGPPPPPRCCIPRRSHEHKLTYTIPLTSLHH